jgi:hypothetical protein
LVYGDVPDVDVPTVVTSSKNVMVCAIDMMGTVIKATMVDIAAGKEAKAHTTQMECGMIIDMHRAMVVVDGRPHVVIAIAYGSGPGRSPLIVVGPQPTVGAVIAPVAVMACDIRKGVMSHPDMAYIVNKIPLAVAVGNIIHDHRRPPAGGIVDIDPLATGIQFRKSYDIVVLYVF